MGDSLWLFAADGAVFIAYWVTVQRRRPTLAKSGLVTVFVGLFLLIAAICVARVVWGLIDAGGLISAAATDAFAAAVWIGLLVTGLLTIEVFGPTNSPAPRKE